MSSTTEGEGGRLFFKSETFTADKRARRPATGLTVHEPGQDLPRPRDLRRARRGGRPGGDRGCPFGGPGKGRTSSCSNATTTWGASRRAVW